MPFRLAPAVALLATLAGSARAATPGQTTSVRTGVAYTIWTDGSGPTRIHVVEIDLSSAEIDVVTTREDERGQTPSAFATAKDAVVVINGDGFSSIDFAPRGLARGDGETWSMSRDDETTALASFSPREVGTTLSLSPPEELVDELDPGVTGAIGGSVELVRGGEPIVTLECAAGSIECVPAPRNAIAMSADGHTAWLVVVDGWQPSSTGLTAVQLARFLAIDLGAESALLLDGGSASALVVDGALASSPSDGAERLVANHIAIRHVAMPAGKLVGHVRERDVYTGADIANATVTLDDGQTFAYDGSALFSFDVPPHWACVTASAPGYQTSAPQCRQTLSGETVWSSIALFPEGEVPTDGGVAADASAPDAGVDGDADIEADASGGCTTTVPGDLSGAITLLGLAGILTFGRRRLRP